MNAVFLASTKSSRTAEPSNCVHAALWVESVQGSSSGVTAESRGSLAAFDRLLADRSAVVKAGLRFFSESSKNRGAIWLLESWLRGDENEQRESWAVIERELDHNRLGTRKFFRK